ncbi:septum formation initiator family protein [Jatrophihabitans sp. YIM 134969]
MTRPLRRRTGADAIGGQALLRPARRAPFVVLVAFVLLGALTCLLVLNTMSAADELEQQSIADANAVTKAQAQQLQVDLAARKAPAALARAATALGMVPADQPAFLRIGADGRVALLGVPGAVNPPPIALQPPAAGGTAATPAATPTGTPTTGTPTTPSTPTTPTTPPRATPTATVSLPGGAR